MPNIGGGVMVPQRKITLNYNKAQSSSKPEPTAPLSRHILIDATRTLKGAAWLKSMNIETAHNPIANYG
jgi:hypothetical protein